MDDRAGDLFTDAAFVIVDRRAWRAPLWMIGSVAAFLTGIGLAARIAWVVTPMQGVGLRVFAILGTTLALVLVVRARRFPGRLYLALGFALWQRYSDVLARRVFRYSILYLTLLFAALLIDRLL